MPFACSTGGLAGLLHTLPGLGTAGHGFFAAALGQQQRFGVPLGARWVTEAKLPPWLVKGWEERARRDAAIRAAEAERMAERVRVAPMSPSRADLGAWTCH